MFHTWTSFFKYDVAKKEWNTAALDLIWLIICVTLVGSMLRIDCCLVGHILWRHVLEKGEQGEIQFMGGDSDVIVTVSGKNFVVVRTWDAHSGYLNTEWTMTQTSNSR